MDQELPRSIQRRPMDLGIVEAVGIWFYSVATNSYLYLMRNDAKHPDTWGLPGGRVETSETLMQAIAKEKRRMVAEGKISIFRK